MNARIILSMVVALFVISLVLVVATNIENNQTLCLKEQNLRFIRNFLTHKKEQTLQ